MAGNRRKMFQFLRKERGRDGKLKDAIGGLISAHKYWVQADGQEVVGDGAANGTTVVTLTISAAKYFVCTHLMASTNIGAIIYLGTGVLGTMTDVYSIDLQNVGGFLAITEKMPIFHYDNRAGAAVTLLMYAPQTAKNVATNNDANHYFDGFIGGVEY